MGLAAAGYATLGDNPRAPEIVEYSRRSFDTIVRPAAPVVLQPARGRFVFARAHAIARKAGTLQIAVIPNARGRLLVANHRYRVTLRLWVSYTPTGGHPGKIGYYGLHLP